MGDCLRAYFEHSEQLPTRLWLRADGESASGLLLQRLPVTTRPPGVTESGAGGVSEEEIEDAWRRVQLVADTSRRTSSHSSRIATAAPAVRGRRRPHVPVGAGVLPLPLFHERVGNMLKALGRAEVDSVLEEFGQVEVRCEFCSRAYRYDSVDCAVLFAGESHARTGGSGVH